MRPCLAKLDLVLWYLELAAGAGQLTGGKPGVGKLGVDQQLEISRVCSQRYIWQAEERISIRLVTGDVIRTEKKIDLVFSPPYGSTFEALLIAEPNI